MAGKNTFSMCVGGSLSSASIGRRSTSYPAKINWPSGGTKLSSPGFSLHLARRTQGWNTGSSTLRATACWPPGAVNDRSKSGTPDNLAVKAIVPDTNAESNRPDGAMVTDSDSIMSTYSSFEVWRTPDFLQGIAGPWARVDDTDGLEVPSVGVDELHISASIKRPFEALTQITLHLLTTSPSTPASAQPPATHSARYCTRSPHRTSHGAAGPRHRNSPVSSLAVPVFQQSPPTHRLRGVGIPAPTTAPCLPRITRRTGDSTGLWRIVSPGEKYQGDRSTTDAVQDGPGREI